VRAAYKVIVEAQGADDLGARGDERSDAHARILRRPPPRGQTCAARLEHCRTAESTFGDASLVRAQCPGCGIKITCAFDGAVVRMCEYCRAVVARETLGVIRSG
jgi:hypothetical protein